MRRAHPIGWLGLLTGPFMIFAGLGLSIHFRAWIYVAAMSAAFAGLSLFTASLSVVIRMTLRRQRPDAFLYFHTCIAAAGVASIVLLGISVQEHVTWFGARHPRQTLVAVDDNAISPGAALAFLRACAPGASRTDMEVRRTSRELTFICVEAPQAWPDMLLVQASSVGEPAAVSAQH
jgi:hypothetical protein